MTHRCRLPLLNLAGEDAVVEAVSGFTFYDRSSQDFDAHRQRFGDVLGRSRFVLCPERPGNLVDSTLRNAGSRSCTGHHFGRLGPASPVLTGVVSVCAGPSTAWRVCATSYTHVTSGGTK